MFAKLRLLMCGWQCSERLSKEFPNSEITLEAKRKPEDSFPFSEINMTRYTISVNALSLPCLTELIEKGWEGLRSGLVNKLREERSKATVRPVTGYFPQEDSNRTLLSILGFNTEVKMVGYELRFSVTRRDYYKAFSLSRLEQDAAVRNHGSKPEMYNFYWGVMIQELIEEKQIKE